MSLTSISVLSSKGVISPPPFVKSPEYETVMGSFAYGVSSDTSDVDVYGFCVPHKEMIFPHLAGHIEGFGRQRQKFDQYQQHHIQYNGKEYDLSIYSIVKYFQLCMDNNPNMIDSLYTPPNCIITMSKIGSYVRSNRKLFLHKGAFHKFKGYAFSMLHKCKNKNPKGKRKELVEKHGCDTKFLYHLVRLTDEIEQLLTTGTLDLSRAREHMKAVRNGEIPLKDIEKWFYAKEIELEKLYHTSTEIPHSPDVDAIKQILLDCLEMKYGTLSSVEVIVGDNTINVIAKIERVIENWRLTQ